MNLLRPNSASAAAQQGEKANHRRRIKDREPQSSSIHRFLDAAIRLGVALVSLNFSILAWQQPTATEVNPLQIVSAGVETSEDAPFVAADYRFLPGDYVYFQFQISGFSEKTKEDSDIRKMSLTYEITPQDAKGVSLTASVTGSIQEDLGNEDKNWMPKRRASFLLPSFVAAGDFHLHVFVKDMVSNKSTERDIPFHIGGTVVAPTTALSVQEFQFLRKEDDTDALDVPAYAPGDTVYTRFTMTGFHLGAGNQYHLSYGLTVNRPDGKVFLTQTNAAELSDKSFYPITFVPSNMSVTTSKTTARGQYVLLLTVRDLIGSQTYQLKRVFTIE